MSERRPLTTLHNGCSAHRTVRRTYGKKGVASAAVGSKNFLIMVDEIQTKMSRVEISDIKEEYEKENQESSEPKGRSMITKLDIRTDKKVNCSAPSANRHAMQPYVSPEKSQPETKTLPDDSQIVVRFMKKFSDRGMLPFEEYGQSVGEKYDVKKIGEGAFSCVFALTFKEARVVDTKDKSDPGLRTSIVKLMPIACPSKGEREGTTDTKLIANELESLTVMDPIHGFIRYRGLVVVEGQWPSNFLEAFRHFKATHKTNAFNEDPETAFPPQQKYALIEMEDAGKELNTIHRPSDFQIYDIFWSLCIHLANSESQVQFEHRDMHISNICIKPSDPTKERIDVDESTVKDMKEPPNTVLGMSNIATTIIDYTYSRVQPPTDFNKPVIFRPALLSDDNYNDLIEDFARKRSGEKRWDFETRVQEITYAKVIECVNLHHDRAYDIRAQSHESEWSAHVPKTNVCWLGYILTCMLQRAGKISKTKYVAGSNDIAKQVQDEIRGNMTALKDVLMAESIDDMPKSAADVVRIGVEKGWLKKEEIEVFKAKLEEDS